jgi:acyl carrier protein
VEGLARPTIDGEFVAPETEIEKTLAGFWTELLGIEKIGVADNFFDLGVHSLIAVRYFRMIKKAYWVDFPISVLFEAPTIGQCAKLIEQLSVPQGDVTSNSKSGSVDFAPKVQFKHIVSMHAGRHPYATPLFICAGMYGNVLNLRHLALHTGQDRPVYGLQARGLYGGEAPHETFEEMAASYLEEVRAVQPHGPYLLGGFSGGGLVAFEMAQQLRDAGEFVDLVVLLDTPYPEPLRVSLADRVSIRLQDIHREGITFFTRWFKERVAVELMRMKKIYNPDQPTEAQFHNSDIEAAFIRAVSQKNGAGGKNCNG